MCTVTGWLLTEDGEDDPVDDNLTPSDTGSGAAEGSGSCGHQGKNEENAKV